ncbi:MAG: nicotinate (nicotinamide) nucleotide adenylyltransferase [Deltaproteobacteria bacterium]|nr:nicotinate (nicotinamide) nucleotide adenylyltransferase [Deltaproteobacteria bacterium]
MNAAGRAPELAVFGGSFNPPHVAHVLAVAYVLAAEAVERVVVVPTFQHPFQKALAPFDDRLEMCRLAFEDLRRVEVSSLERELGGDSYTVRTLEALHAREPSMSLALCIGADVLAERHLWHRAEQVEELARQIVLGRQGFDSPPGASPPLPQVSSTEIRRRLAASEDVGPLVPLRVRRYIEEHGLYRQA